LEALKSKEGIRLLRPVVCLWILLFYLHYDSYSTSSTTSPRLITGSSPLLTLFKEYNNSNWSRGKPEYEGFSSVPRLSRRGRDLFYDLSASCQAGLRIVPQAGPAVSHADKPRKDGALPPGTSEKAASPSKLWREALGNSLLRVDPIFVKEVVDKYNVKIGGRGDLSVT
jgi:hypothetical protein